MPIDFKHYDSLRLFAEVARHDSFSDAADILNMTKGAVSYQIKTLEADLGFKLFDRNPRGVALTPAGRDLQKLSQSHFGSLELELLSLKKVSPRSLTVGMSSYFASRWLSPRLMTFMQNHPEIQLRIQPMTQLFDLERQGVDLAVRWGHGMWEDAEVTPLLPLPAWPVGNRDAADAVCKNGLEAAFSMFTLLRDHDDSNAWSDWLKAAGLPHQTRKDTLIIPDPNVRVQAVIDGQGIALNDALIEQELRNGKLFRLSDLELGNYGYFLVKPPHAQGNPSVDAFSSWVQNQLPT